MANKHKDSKLRPDVLEDKYYILFHSTIRTPYILRKLFESRKQVSRYIKKFKGGDFKKYEIVYGADIKAYGIPFTVTPGLNHTYKYDYPADVITTQQRKNFRNKVNKYHGKRIKKWRKETKETRKNLTELLKKYRNDQQKKKKRRKVIQEP